MSKKNFFSWPEENYNIEILRSGKISNKDIRKEYSKLRSIARKRLERMSKSEYNMTQAYLYNRDRFKPLASIGSERELQYKLFELRKFLSSNQSSVSGWRKIEDKAIKKFKEHGITGINRGNIREFGDFMDYLRSVGRSRRKDSEQDLDLFLAIERRGVDKREVLRDFEWWRKHVEELESMPRFRNPENVSAEVYRKALTDPDYYREVLEREGCLGE